MQNLELILADLDGVTVLQPAVGLEGFDRRKAKHLALLAKGIEPEAFFKMRSDDRDIQHARKLGGGASVVDMTVRQKDLVDFNAGLGNRRHDARNIATGVDNRRLARVGTPEQGAILGEGRYGNDAIFEHGHLV
jgi:hypothetical protein